MPIIVAVIFWFILSLVVGNLASQKGKSFGGYFALSLFLSPILGLLIVAAAPPGEKQENGDTPDSKDITEYERVKKAMADGTDYFAPEYVEKLRIKAEQAQAEISKLQADKEQEEISKSENISSVDELQKLAKMHKEGTLSDEEFASMKAKIIN